MKNIRVGQNENIDNDTRARAMASVNKDPLGDFIKSRGLDSGPAEAPAYGMTLADRQTPRTKPSVVTKEELKGMSLRDYMNKKQGLTRRKDKVNPTLGEAKDKNAQDAADAIDPGDIRTRELGKTRGGPSYDIAGKPSNAGPDVEYVPDSLNRRTGATAKMLKENIKKPMSKEDYMLSREQYKQGQDESAPSTFRKGGSVKGYASGGSVSASRRGDGIAQRGKTRGRMC